MNIGIVTITYNSEAFINSFLQDVFKQTFDNFILYVIDNGSSDNTLNILNSTKDSRLEIINNNKNVGVAKANNQGILKAIEDKCDQILIINNDVEFEEKLIDKLLYLQEKTNAGLVAPKIMYHDNPDCIWYAGANFNKSKGYLPVHTGIGVLDHERFNRIQQVEYAPTCCLLIQKQVFQDIGLMDEKYFVYFDDTDFCYRVFINSKHSIYYAPDIKFYHKVGGLTKSFVNSDKNNYRGPFFLEQMTKNHVYFLKRIGTGYAFLYIFWLFFRNNIRFFISPIIKKDFATFLLINRAYFKGLLL